MKNFSEILEEVTKVTKPLIDNKFIDLVIKMKKSQSPYTYGANVMHIAGNYITFSYEDDLQRDKSIKKLKKLGVPAKLISKSTQSKGATYRYDAHINIEVV